MRTIQELAAAAAITDVSTTQISEVQGTQWATNIIHFGEDLRRFDQVAIINTWMVGKGDKTVVIPKTTGTLTMDVAPAAANDVRDNTELTNLDTVSLTIAAADWKLGKVSIAKQIVLTSRIDLMKEARYQIAQNLARTVDVAIATSLEDTSVTNVVWGGDATGVDSLAAGDIITTDLVANAMALIEANNFKPKYLFITPTQLKTFRKDPQFVSAAEYGSNEVVMKGEIGDYLGVKIITTTNCPAYAGSATDTNETPTAWAVAGKVCPMVGVAMDNSPIAVALAWKEMPNIGYEYEQDEAIHKFYLNQAFVTGIVQPGAVTLIKVANV